MEVDGNSNIGYCVDYKKTSLRPYIETFEKFVNSLMIESQKIKRGMQNDIRG